jgi:hypothetical protein
VIKTISAELDLACRLNAGPITPGSAGDFRGASCEEGQTLSAEILASPLGYDPEATYNHKATLAGTQWA